MRFAILIASMLLLSNRCSWDLPVYNKLTYSYTGSITGRMIRLVVLLRHISSSRLKSRLHGYVTLAIMVEMVMMMMVLYLTC